MKLEDIAVLQKVPGIFENLKVVKFTAFLVYEDNGIKKQIKEQGLRIINNDWDPAFQVDLFLIQKYAHIFAVYGKCEIDLKLND